MSACIGLLGAVGSAVAESADEVPQDVPVEAAPEVTTEVPETNFLTEHLVGAERANTLGLSVRGWLSQGVTLNGESQDSNFNGPVSFNDRANEYQLNQLYFILERSIDKTSDKFDLGGRVDFMYGTDAQFTQATGWDVGWVEPDTSRFYQVAMPQMFLEGLVPVGSGLTVKAGHFYTLIGNEVVTAPDNFFYSHAYTMQYGEPFTHTGVLFSYALSDSVSLTAGVTRGWDNMSEVDKDPQGIGAIAWSDGDTTATFSLTSGNEAPSLNRTMYSLVVGHQITDRLKYTFQHDWGYQEEGAASGAAAHWYGVNQYLTYATSDKVSLGLRAEWFRDADGVRVAGVRSGSPGAESDYVGITAGLNYQVTSCLRIRPELRYDVQLRDDSSVPSAFADADSVNQWTTAVDAILQF